MKNITSKNCIGILTHFSSLTVFESNNFYSTLIKFKKLKLELYFINSEYLTFRKKITKKINYDNRFKYFVPKTFNDFNNFIKKKKILIINNIGRNDVVLGISASGTAPYILSALAKAKENEAITGLLVCNISDKLDFMDHYISVIVGPEVVAGSTRMKAGTATKMVLNMISTTAMIKINKTYGNVMVDLNACNDKLWDRGSRIIMHFTALNYDQSFTLLKKAKGEVKTALVMEKLKLGFEDANKILLENDGAISKLL